MFLNSLRPKMSKTLAESLDSYVNNRKEFPRCESLLRFMSGDL